MGTNELIKQLDNAYNLLDQRTRDLELAAQIGQQLLATNCQLTAELETLKEEQDEESEVKAQGQTDTIVALRQRIQELESDLRAEKMQSAIASEEVEALEEQLNEQEDRACCAEKDASKVKEEVSKLSVRLAELETAAQQAASDACVSANELASLQAEVSKAQQLEKENANLQEANLDVTAEMKQSLEEQDHKINVLKQKEAAALVQCQEAREKLSVVEKANVAAERRVQELMDRHQTCESEYNKRVEAMREKMSFFEDTIAALQAEGFEHGMEGNIQEEMQGIESLVEAASEEVELKDQEIAELKAKIQTLEAAEGKVDAAPKAQVKAQPRTKHISEAKAGIHERNKLKMAGFTPRRQATPSKSNNPASPSSGLPTTIARMQQTLTNLRTCASKMKNSGYSTVKQRMELSEKAMSAYRELKELTAA